jgi:hypothetical protein
MPEGEVILRLALHLLKHPRVLKAITVSVDRHHVKSGGSLAAGTCRKSEIRAHYFR